MLDNALVTWNADTSRVSSSSSKSPVRSSRSIFWVDRRTSRLSSRCGDYQSDRRSRVIHVSLSPLSSARSGWRSSGGVVNDDERKCQGCESPALDETSRGGLGVASERQFNFWSFPSGSRESLLDESGGIFFRKRRTSCELVSSRKNCRDMYDVRIRNSECRLSLTW